MWKAAFFGAILSLLASSVAADVIERACLTSDRPAADRALCGCIQDVANLTLTPSEQKKAATFFGNPHRAQEVRQSISRSDQRFWERYKLFGQSAKTYCS
jgi:hypothetical protein